MNLLSVIPITSDSNEPNSNEFYSTDPITGNSLPMRTEPVSEAATPVAQQKHLSQIANKAARKAGNREKRFDQGHNIFAK